MPAAANNRCRWHLRAINDRPYRNPVKPNVGTRLCVCPETGAVRRLVPIIENVGATIGRPLRYNSLWKPTALPRMRMESHSSKVKTMGAYLLFMGINCKPFLMW